MPISAEKMKLYPGGSIKSPEWLALRASVLKRAEHRCEKCRAANGVVVCRGAGKDAGTYMLEDGDVHDAETGEYLGAARGSEYNGEKVVKIVLTIAHVDCDETNNQLENLRAWCQRCHNRHDAPHRRKNAALTRHLKLGDDLFLQKRGEAERSLNK